MRSFLTFLILASVLHAQAQHYCSKYKTATPANRLEITDHRSDSMDIVHTLLALDMTNVSVQQIAGVATLSLQSKVATNGYVRFDFEGLSVDSVKGPLVAGFTQTDTTLVVMFTSPLAAGQQTSVAVHYHGSPMKDASGWGGFYFSGDFSWNLGVGFADDPHSYGRIWFPCFDNFIERSEMEYRVRVRNDRTASCNGTLQGVTDHGDSTRTFHWVLPQTIPSYLACVAVAPYTTVEGTIAGMATNIPYQIFARSSDSMNVVNSFTHLDETVQAFELAYGKYRFEKVGYSLVPFNSGAMEHATNIAYPISAANGGLAQEELMAHELAHMWWGDNVTCQTDGDMWINEGWASFSEYLFQEAVYGRLAYENTMKADLRQMLHRGHLDEGGYRAVSGQPHEYVYGDHVYKKGALVAHNLRGYMGDEAFFDACAKFMEKFKYAPVSSDSMEKYFSLFSGMELTNFFRDWVFSGGYNVVVLDSFVDNGNGTVDLYLQQKLKGRENYHDGVPVYYTVYAENGQTQSGKTEMSGQYETKTISTALAPKMMVLYGRNEQAQARTVDRIVVKQTGALTLPNFYWGMVETTTAPDSALVWFEHIWAAPDAIKDFRNQPYRLSSYHYWRISGLGAENLTMKGTLTYDGRPTGTNQFDVDLLAQGEDSLVLLYRQNPYDDWREHAHYTKNMLSSATDGFGIIEVTQMRAGEYTLANIDHSVLGSLEVENALRLTVFPNPAKGSLTVRLENSHTDDIKPLEILDMQGRVVLAYELAGPQMDIPISALPRGTYLCRLKTAGGELTRKFVVGE